MSHAYFNDGKLDLNSIYDTPAYIRPRKVRGDVEIDVQKRPILNKQVDENEKNEKTKENDCVFLDSLENIADDASTIF